MNNTPHGYNEDGEYTAGLPSINLINKNTTMTKKIGRLEEITNRLIYLKDKIKEVSDLKSELTFEKTELQNELFNILKKDRRDRFETEQGKVQIVKKKDISIIDTIELEKWVKEQGKEEIFFTTTLNKPHVKAFAKDLLKEGEVLVGTEPVESEYIKITNSQ